MRCNVQPWHQQNWRATPLSFLWQNFFLWMSYIHSIWHQMGHGSYLVISFKNYLDRYMLKKTHWNSGWFLKKLASWYRFFFSNFKSDATEHMYLVYIMLHHRSQFFSDTRLKDSKLASPVKILHKWLQKEFCNSAPII